jgi:hypothetical protein
VAVTAAVHAEAHERCPRALDLAVPVARKHVAVHQRAGFQPPVRIAGRGQVRNLEEGELTVSVAGGLIRLPDEHVRVVGLPGFHPGGIEAARMKALGQAALMT